jgi:hypothetical protein
MKKNTLKKLALMGIGSVLVTQTQANAERYSNDNRGRQYYTADSMNSSRMSQDSLSSKGICVCKGLNSANQ